MVTRWRQQSRLFLGASLLCIAPFFFIGGPGYHSPRSYKAAWDLGHILFFLLFTLLVDDLRAGKKEASGSPLIFFLAAFLLVLLLGTSVEFIQQFVDGRSPDVHDVLRNQLGCLTAFAFGIRPQLLRARWQQRMLQGGVTLLLLAAIWPVTQALIDEYLAIRRFPILADFETPFERFRWENGARVEVVSEPVRHGQQAARLQLSTEQYSGVALFYFPGDWRDYRTLHFSVYHPEPVPLKLNCRIHDSHHKEHDMAYGDRFNRVFSLVQGWNDLVVSLDEVRHAPHGRSMDMAHIEGFGLFVMNQPKSQTIYLDHIYLDR